MSGDESKARSEPDDERSKPVGFGTSMGSQNKRSRRSLVPMEDRLAVPRRASETRTIKSARTKQILSGMAYRKLRRLVGLLRADVEKDPELSCANDSQQKGFRADLIRLIVEAFPLKRGRPADPLIDKACELLRKGRSVPSILREQIKDWPTLDSYTRYLAGKGLRQAARRRKQHHQNRQRKGVPEISSTN